MTSPSSSKVKLEKKRTHQRYKLADGTKVPGVTTALGVINKPALVHWAWKLGCEGIDYKKVSSEACDIGTIAHFLCECHIKGLEPDIGEFSAPDVDKAENAFLKFLDWWQRRNFRLVASEEQLVSETHGYGGTCDIVAKTGSELWLIDLKTSKGIYDEYWYQVAAYRALWEECRKERIDAVCIVRIGKEAEDGDFEVVERTDTHRDMDVFLAALKLYKLMKAKR